MRTRLLVVLAVMLMLTAGEAIANLAVDGGFETFPPSGRWWAASPYYTFTVIDGVYYNRDWLTGASGLPRINGFPQPEWTNASWNPYTWKSLEYNMTAHADTSAGYDNPVKTGYLWLKKNPGQARFYSGVDQIIYGLTPGLAYQVSVWGTSCSPSEADKADMRILVDTDAMNEDARLAPISSTAIPNRPEGRYWLWSNLGNNRIGTLADTAADDVTGFYQIYDQISVQFVATDTTARVFLLMDWRNFDADGNDNGQTGIGFDDLSVTLVPEPSGLVALGLPALLGGLSIIRRRRS
jgi:hypothetical protein